MKIEIQEKEKVPEVKKYPYIGVSETGNIVLFTSPQRGTCLKTYNETTIGNTSSNWFESEYTPFEGKITLSNE